MSEEMAAAIAAVMSALARAGAEEPAESRWIRTARNEAVRPFDSCDERP